MIRLGITHSPCIEGAENDDGTWLDVYCSLRQHRSMDAPSDPLREHVSFRTSVRPLCDQTYMAHWLRLPHGVCSQVPREAKPLMDTSTKKLAISSGTLSFAVKIFAVSIVH